MEFEIKLARCEEHSPRTRDRIKGRDYSLKMCGDVYYIDAENRDAAIKKVLSHILNVPTQYEQTREQIEEEWPIPERESWPIGIVEVCYNTEDGGRICEKYCDSYNIVSPLYKYKTNENGKVEDLLTINKETNSTYVDQALVNVQNYIQTQLESCENNKKRDCYKQLLLDFTNRYGNHSYSGEEIKNWRSE